MVAAEDLRFPLAKILIFAKAPVPGACKTRLIPILGREGAARLAGELLNSAVERACQTRLAPVELWCAPDTSHSLFRQLAGRYPLSLQAQRGTDLGERMGGALRVALASAERAVLIGTDCPDLDAAYLEHALDALGEVPVVLGPAADGGYVLLGVNRDAAAALDALFAVMPWGSDSVAAKTRERIRAAGLRWAELATLVDIDRPEDLARGHERNQTFAQVKRAF
jgi:hypothetical protein